MTDYRHSDNLSRYLKKTLGDVVHGTGFKDDSLFDYNNNSVYFLGLLIDFQLKHLLIICTLPLSSFALSDYEAALSDSEKAGISDGKNQSGRDFSGEEFRSASALQGSFFMSENRQMKENDLQKPVSIFAETFEIDWSVLSGFRPPINLEILKEEKR